MSEGQGTLANISWAHVCFDRVRSSAPGCLAEPKSKGTCPSCAFCHIMFTNTSLAKPVSWPSQGSGVRTVTLPRWEGPAKSPGRGSPGRSIEFGQECTHHIYEPMVPWGVETVQLTCTVFYNSHWAFTDCWQGRISCVILFWSGLLLVSCVVLPFYRGSHLHPEREGVLTKVCSEEVTGPWSWDRRLTSPWISGAFHVFWYALLARQTSQCGPWMSDPQLPQCWEFIANYKLWARLFDVVGYNGENTSVFLW